MMARKATVAMAEPERLRLDSIHAAKAFLIASLFLWHWQAGDDLAPAKLLEKFCLSLMRWSLRRTNIFSPWPTRCLTDISLPSR